MHEHTYSHWANSHAQAKDDLAPFQSLKVLSFGMARMFMLTKQYQSN